MLHLIIFIIVHILSCNNIPEHLRVCSAVTEEYCCTIYIICVISSEVIGSYNIFTHCCQLTMTKLVFQFTQLYQTGCKYKYLKLQTASYPNQEFCSSSIQLLASTIKNTNMDTYSHLCFHIFVILAVAGILGNDNKDT